MLRSAQSLHQKIEDEIQSISSIEPDPLVRQRATRSLKGLQDEVNLLSNVPSNQFWSALYAAVRFKFGSYSKELERVLQQYEMDSKDAAGAQFERTRKSSWVVAHPQFEGQSSQGASPILQHIVPLEQLIAQVTECQQSTLQSQGLPTALPNASSIFQSLTPPPKRTHIQDPPSIQTNYQPRVIYHGQSGHKQGLPSISAVGGPPVPPEVDEGSEERDGGERSSGSTDIANLRVDPVTGTVYHI